MTAARRRARATHEGCIAPSEMTAPGPSARAHHSPHGAEGALAARVTGYLHGSKRLR